MNTYIHPLWYFIAAGLIFILLINSIINDILKGNKAYANFNIYFDILLGLKFVLIGLTNRKELQITAGYIEREEKKRYDCLRIGLNEIFGQLLARIFFCLGFGYNLGKLINLIVIFKISDLDVYDYICLYPYTLIPILLVVEIIITDFEKPWEEMKFGFICVIISIIILSGIAFLLDWAYYGDIEKVAIGLGISYGFMIISFFLFNLIVKCTESKEKMNYMKVAEDKIKFFDK